MDLLLVGENASFVRILSLELAFQGFEVRTVTDAAELKAALEDSTPDAIVLDHVEPMDIFALNPRDHGYEGPLFILIADHLPAPLLQRLRTAEVHRKPYVLESLSAEIRLVLER